MASAKALTAKQEQYAQNRAILCMTQRQAYKAAYDVKTASDECIDTNACLLEQNAKVAQRIKQLQESTALDKIITRQQILTELANIALANGTDYAAVETITGEDGSIRKTIVLKDTADVPTDKRSAIAGIERTATGIKVKQHDKVKALELCGKYHGMWVDKVETEHSGTVTVEQFLGEISGDEY